ncbi:hypothetical protein BDV06DRAFT_219151 [Aspergillus oleicola]
MASNNDPDDRTIYLTTHPSSISGAVFAIICELLGYFPILPPSPFNLSVKPALTRSYAQSSLPYRVHSSSNYAFIEALHDPTWSVSCPIPSRAGNAWYLLETYDTAHRYTYDTESPLADEIAEWERNLENIMRFQWMHRGRQFHDRIGVLCMCLEARLKVREAGWVVGKELSLADIATFPYISYMRWAEDDNEGRFPTVKAWYDRLAGIPGFWRGMAAAGMGV